MVTAKDILVKPIKSADGNAFVKAHHYSGKVAQNSQLHLGVFLDGRLHGVMQFGPSLDKRKIQGLVSGTAWHEFLELNRMAFDEHLPRNSESRALSIAWRLMRKHAPQVKWVISFADATQCGDGAIYRATGFVLTGINRSDNLCRLPSGRVIHKMTLETGSNGKTKYVKYPDFGNRSYHEITGGRYDFNLFSNSVGGEIVPGFQIRYIYFLDPAYRARLTVPELPYSEIEKRGAAMYLGQKPGDRGETDSAPQSNAETGDASSTRSLSLPIHRLDA
jgi:hypothetical protein